MKQKQKEKTKKKRFVWEELLKKRLGRLNKRSPKRNPYPQTGKCSA